MREIPKLFSAPMVQAILAGRKTMTRRLDGLEEINARPDDWKYRGHSGDHHEFVGLDGECVSIPVGCHKGDILAVRETWAAPVVCDRMKPSDIPCCTPIHYLADGPKPEGFGKTRPGIFLPKWAWRIKRPIIAEERIERVATISEEDARAEGVRFCTMRGGTGAIEVDGIDQSCPDCKQRPYTWPFERLWCSIHGPESWTKNEWVRVLTFAAQ